MNHFKLKNRSLKKPISRKKLKTAFFGLFDGNLSKSLFSAKKSTKIYQKNGALLHFFWKTPRFYAIRMTKFENYLLRAEQDAKLLFKN